jgi:crotonobetainyl-CoA:carnitine CoA-transferase CaiB-like acyl-CoA transferase
MTRSALCAGLNVIEIGSGSVAAAMTGMILADAGARVIKLEPPEGDALRGENASGFLVWNRGKESRIADLRAGEGRQVLCDLVRGADIVIEAFAPGVTRAWGVDGETLRAASPALIHCSIRGFGSAGPYASLKAYDPVVAAKLGLWDRAPYAFREGPLMMPVPWASFGAAMQATAGLMGALIVRGQTGRGQCIEATLASGLEPIDYMVATVVQLAAKRKRVGDSARSPVPPSRYGVLLATRDGRLIQTSTVQPHQGRALCKVAGIESLMDDPRYSKLPTFDTIEDAQAWEDQLLEAFHREDLSYWLPLLEGSPDIAFEVACTSEDGVRHPQIVHNGDVITIEDPRVGPIQQVGPIGHFSRTPIAPSRSAPGLDEHAGEFTLGDRNFGHAGAPPHAFSGVTIVEFGYFYAMPYAVAMLAALGARVIKIEDARGDPHRASFGAEVASNKTTAGKESISLDLRSPRGQHIVRQIIAQADVFITGFRAGVAEKLGLGYEVLQALNPRLLYVHAAGYGPDGPYAHRALYAQAAQAVGGSFGRQVGYWSDPARVAGWSVAELQAVIFPRLHQVIDGDSNAALVVLAALSLGIYHQRRTGEGQRLDMSMIAANAWAYGDDFCIYAGKPPARLCDEDYFGVSALERIYRCGDETWLCLAARRPKELQALAAVLGEPKFVGMSDGEIMSALSSVFAQRPALDWEAALTAVGVGAASVSMGGLASTTSFDHGLKQSGLTVVCEHPLFGEMTRWAPPVSFSEGEGRIARPCMRGEHNRAILQDLGYGDAEIADLEASGVVFPP